MVNKEREKPEDFIGWKSEDGKLEVIGIYDKQGTVTRFKVTCTECSKDKELFPEGYFVISKKNLLRGSKPCGCSKRPTWSEQQYLLVAQRTATKKKIKVKGIVGSFIGKNTKLDCMCYKCKTCWTPTINGIVNGGYGCPACAINKFKPHNKLYRKDAISRCRKMCKKYNYKFKGLPEGWNKGAMSKVQYYSKSHGLITVVYNNFIDNGNRCPFCVKEEQLNNSTEYYGWYETRQDETDCLYVLNFNNEYLKVGRSFNLKRRIQELKRKSGIKNPSIIS